MIRLFRAAALAASMAAVSAYGSLPAAEPAVGSVVRSAAFVAPAPLDLGPEIATFYRDRDFRPVWIVGSALRPEARRLLTLVPANIQLEAAVQAAASGDPHALTRADLLLTKAYAETVLTVHQGPSADRMRYVDAALRPKQVSLRDRLGTLASARFLGAYVDTIGRRNPAFDGLRRGLELYRSQWSRLPQERLADVPDLITLARRLGVPKPSRTAVAERLREFQNVHGLPQTGLADGHTIAALNRGAVYYEDLIKTNIERARDIPARPIGRYILVDTASARLWLVEDGNITGWMRVIVGKAAMQTPVMAALMRHVVFNPYWNLPPDLIRQRARNAVRRGAAAITSERLQVLSDWSEEARALDARQVNWNAVASGREQVNLRQLPGPTNMMGEIKFMFPNELGIYLHDTPFKEHFAHSDRRLSSGCVRVQDAARLARWVFRGTPPAASGAPEQEVELPEPVPVYITYLTALPTRSGVIFQNDGYSRDTFRPASTRNRGGRARS